MVMKPWEERTRSTKALSPLVRVSSTIIVGIRASASAAGAAGRVWRIALPNFVISAAARRPTCSSS